MEITLLSVPGCPHVDEARRRLDEALHRAGLTARITEQVLSSETDAARHSVHGSPTILLDGHDPFPEPPRAPGFACRLYPGDTGPEGAPTVDALIDAMTSTTGPSASTAEGVEELAVGDGSADAPLGERVRWAAFDRLVSGHPVPADVLAGALGVEVRVAQGAIEDQARRGLVDVDDDGRVLGAHGLTLVPTDFQLVLDGVVLHTWCALDAIGIPAGLGSGARATIRSGDGEWVTIEVRAGEPTRTGDAVVWLPTGPCNDLRADFCAQANLFTTTTALDSWRRDAGDPPGRALTVPQAAELGRGWWTHGPDGCCQVPFTGPHPDDLPGAPPMIQPPGHGGSPRP